jgi:cytochrome c553
MRAVLLISGIAMVCLGLAASWDLFTRLIPESSPVARGAAYAASHQCADTSCSAERRGDSSVCEHLDGEVQCKDVSAYWDAVELKHQATQRQAAAIDNRLLQGEILARQYNCFRCHGELGQGGLDNAGSLKGYIPGYFGKDFELLTDGAREDVVREWIVTGSNHQLVGRPVTGFMAQFFLDRQAISMPSFSSLSSAELDLLASYVIALHNFGPLDKAGLRRYVEATSTGPAHRYGAPGG